MLELFVCARIRKVYIGLKVMLSPITKTIYNNKNRMEKHHISKRGHRMKKRNVITISCITVVVAVIIAAILFVNRKVSFDPAKTSQLCDELYDELHSFEEVYAGQYGKLTVENLPDILEDMEPIAQEYKADGKITEYSVEETCIYMGLPGGVEYLYCPTIEGVMTGSGEAGQQTGEIVTIEPFTTDGGMFWNYVFGGKSPDKEAREIAEEIPDLYSFPDENNMDEFLPENSEKLEGKAVIIWYGHGAMSPNYGPVLTGSVKPTEENLRKYQNLMDNEDKTNELVITNTNLAYTHYYFENELENGSMEGSLVYLAACHSAETNELVEAFTDKGADLIVGNSDAVSTRYNLYTMCDFLGCLRTEKEDGSYPTADEAIQHAKQENGEIDTGLMSVGAEVKLCYAPNEQDYRLVEAESSSEHTVQVSDSPAGTYFKKNIQPLYTNTTDSFELQFEYVKNEDENIGGSAYYFRADSPYLSLLGVWFDDYNDDGTVDICTATLDLVRYDPVPAYIEDREDMGRLCPTITWHMLDESGNLLGKSISYGLLLPRRKEEFSLTLLDRTFLLYEAYDDDARSSDENERSYNDGHVDNVKIVGVESQITDDGVTAYTPVIHSCEREYRYFCIPEAPYIRYRRTLEDASTEEIYRDGAWEINWRDENGNELDSPIVNTRTTGIAGSEEETFQIVSGYLSSALGTNEFALSGCTWENRWEQPFFQFTDGTEPYVTIELSSTNTFDFGESGTTYVEIHR